MTAKYDFSGYASKYNIKCSDGRTILTGAFKTNHGTRVPLVFQHMHTDPSNVLGHVLLEDREDGLYAYASFNDTPNGQNAKKQVQHGDIVAMSIYANKLVERSSIVHQGVTREVSLVLSGANPGALIDTLSITHSDGTDEILDDEAIITSGDGLTLYEIKHADDLTDTFQKKDEHQGENKMADDKTVGDVFNTLTDEQKTVVYAMIAQALSGEDDDDIEQFDAQGETFMKHNIFSGGDDDMNGPALTHDQLSVIFSDAPKIGSLKEAFLAHAGEYGIENIEFLFPDARTINNQPDLITRDQTWVNAFMGASNHTPFSRIKSISSDMTVETARALGYVKATLKKEDYISLAKRVTTPTTVYIKSKLDRDDIIDVVDMDVVAWKKGNMRLSLDEEIARAGLLGDGRDSASDDKIQELNIRPIYKDGELYVHRVELAADANVLSMIESIIRARKEYKGSGSPVMFTTTDFLTNMLLVKDGVNRRLYNTEAELASALRVSKIVEVPVMDNISRVVDATVDYTLNLLAILVNPQDYTYGADRGGAVALFDDFDIDYNQQKFLIETRCSGALTKPKSAVVVEQIAASG